MGKRDNQGNEAMGTRDMHRFPGAREVLAMSESTPAYPCECGHSLYDHRSNRWGASFECLVPGCDCKEYDKIPAGWWDFDDDEDGYYNPDPGPEPADDAL
jgi:hypothetical protein